MLTPLKFHRLSKQIKTIDLAREASVTVSMISKIENGKARGSDKTRTKIARAIGLTVQSLFGGK